VEYYERYLEAMYERDERLRHFHIAATRFLADELYRRGVRKLYIGYPIMLSQDNGNEYDTNIWRFRRIVPWIVDIFRECGIEVELLPEDYTSKGCSICGIRHKTEGYRDAVYMQEDQEEDKRRYKCSAKYGEKAGTQDKDIEEDRELPGNS
jgi:putative transposase